MCAHCHHYQRRPRRRRKARKQKLRATASWAIRVKEIRLEYTCLPFAADRPFSRLAFAAHTSTKANRDSSRWLTWVVLADFSQRRVKSPFESNLPRAFIEFIFNLFETKARIVLDFLGEALARCKKKIISRAMQRVGGWLPLFARCWRLRHINKRQKGFKIKSDTFDILTTYIVVRLSGGTLKVLGKLTSSANFIKKAWWAGICFRND